ncbi:MAG: YdcF family protein [Flavobacteriales bacterium]
MRAATPASVRLRRIGEFLMGRVMLVLLTLVLLMVLIWAFRYPLLRVTGRFLVREDAQARGDVMIVLGGAPMDRGLAATCFFKEGIAPRAVFTGENVPQSLQAAGLLHSEAQLTRDVAVLAGLPGTSAFALERGTSTWEEGEAVRDLAKASGYDTVVVVTTEFHTRRVGRVFRKLLEPAGITVFVRAARSMEYDAAHWWRTEDGLLMVNNEYVKLLYYAFKY